MTFINVLPYDKYESYTQRFPVSYRLMKILYYTNEAHFISYSNFLLIIGIEATGITIPHRYNLISYLNGCFIQKDIISDGNT